MKFAALVLSLLTAACATSTAPGPAMPPPPAPPPVASDGSIAFVNVNVIPMTRGAGVVRDQTVIVRDGRIEWIGEASAAPVTAGAMRIDGRGKYLIPGLADMHVHLEYFESAEMLKLFTKKGITFVRNMDGRPSILEWRDAVAAGRLDGPSIMTAGPILDGAPPVIADNQVVRTEAEGRALVRAQQAAGYDFVKVYTNLPTKAYEAILDEAGKLGIPVAGHVPRRSSMSKALQHHASIEHLTDFDELVESDASPVRNRFDWSKLHLAMEADPRKMAEAGRMVAKANVAIVPTLVQADHALATETMLASWMKREELLKVPAEVRDHWETRVRSVSERTSAADWPVAERGRANRRALVKALHDAGARIIAGTDTPNPFVVPGNSLHRELALYVAAGLAPEEALATATREAARFAGQPEVWGTIETGKRADLVLLGANPLANIDALSRIESVVVRGRMVD